MFLYILIKGQKQDFHLFTNICLFTIEGFTCGMHNLNNIILIFFLNILNEKCVLILQWSTVVPRNENVQKTDSKNL